MGEVVTVPVPAPLSGVNYADGVDAPNSRAITDARYLLNLYPSGPSINVRGGISLHADLTGTAAIRSIFSLPLIDGTEKLYCSNDSKLWDVSTSTPADVTGTTTPTTNDWQGAVYGHRLFLCNGLDTVQVLTGSGVATDSTFTGVTLANLVNVSSYKERLYFVEKNTAKFWYGNTQAVGASALTSYDLAYFLKRGGRLLFAGSFTNQLASTSADLFMACSSEGEVLFYSGSYPGADGWGLVARYKIGKPLGYNAFVEVDNDVWIITDSGIVPASLLFSGGPTVALNQIARKINVLISEYAAITPTSHLWWGRHWPQGRRVYVSVPQSGAANILLVCNTDNGAWCTYEYTDNFGLCMAIFGGLPYMGSAAGNVYKAEYGHTDDGSEISFDGKLPFSYYGYQKNYKIWRDIRPLMRTVPGVSLKLSVQTNFQDTPTEDTITATPGAIDTPWGSDWGSSWSSGTKYFYDWYSLRGQGHSGAIRVKGAIKDAPLEFTGFDLRFEVGGPV